jgi:hypothetical protein
MRAGSQVRVLGPEDDLAGMFLQVPALPCVSPAAAPCHVRPQLLHTVALYGCPPEAFRSSWAHPLTQLGFSAGLWEGGGKEGPCVPTLATFTRS